MGANAGELHLIVEFIKDGRKHIQINFHCNLKQAKEDNF